MKSKMKQFTGVFITLLIFGGVILLFNAFMFISNPKIYGNTEEEIIKAIYNTELVNKTAEISIIDIIDKGTTRVAGFTINNEQTGVIALEKDKKGDYVYNSAEVRGGNVGNYVQWFENVYHEEGENSQECADHDHDIDESGEIAFIVVSTAGEEYEVNLKVNETHDLKGQIQAGKPTMLAFEMPDNQVAKSYNFDLDVIDEDGNNIFE